MRKLLTSNREADLDVEMLMEDNDFHTSMKRDDFEALCTEKLHEFSLALKQMLAHSGVNIGAIDYVELVGEATRIPMI